MSNGAQKFVYGALGGALGAACMTVLRMAAHRRGVIDKTVSQAAEEWLADRLDLQPARDEPAVHHVLDELLHLGYGATLGLGYAALQRSRAGGRLSAGALYGLGTWFVGSWGLLPALGAKRPPWRKGLASNAVDLGAHALFGAVTALVSSEMAAQTNHRRTSDEARYRARTG